MADTAPEQPQIYLLSPPAFELSRFPDLLARVLDAVPVACMRLTLPGADADTVSRAGDALREVCHARDVALVLSDHVLLAQTLGLDGVHLSDGARSLRAARKTLGADVIVGSYCGQSRHDGLTAGEAGADYVAFGPVAESGLGDGAVAPSGLFEWWSEVIELPVVAEGALNAERIAALAPYADFFGIGPEIWSDPDPAACLSALHAALTA
ncbi:MAG: thiamine phosphate synthase [Rhodobacteraceae bacterium]|nr:thiamine phosphate synthase [Paracoccaceae bacterium]